MIRHPVEDHAMTRSRMAMLAGAAMALAVPAMAQEHPSDVASTERGDRSLRGDRDAFRAARREARQEGRIERRSVPVAQAESAAPVGSAAAETITRRMQAINGGGGGDRDRDSRPNWRDRDANGDGRRDWRWRDRDRDGVPNGRDRDWNNDGRRDWGRGDRDRDGRPNWRDRDANGDGRRDWRWRDRDRDGVPNGRDWDRDGDGRPNWRDGKHRHDPWRYWKRPRPSYVIVRPSHSYRYAPHWWGSSYYFFDDRYDRYGYDYGAYYRPGYGFYGSQFGSGWATLYSFLRQDPAGRHWALWFFDSDRNGRLGKQEARNANRAFDDLADRNRDGYIGDREVRWALDELRDEYRYSYRYG
jgi:hypothetical protein